MTQVNSRSPKKKILLIQPSFQPPGGANAVVVWMLHALQKDYTLSTMSWDTVDVDEINNFYGTNLKAEHIRSHRMPTFFRGLVDCIPDDPWQFQRYCALMRWCKLVKRKYDLVISANNECDFGGKGIQYVHFPYLKDHPSRQLEPEVLRDPSKFFWRRVLSRLRPWRLISGFSYKGMKKNITLVNSKWTGVHFKKAYGLEAKVVYPPVSGNFEDISWEKRNNAFVCIGRISGEKRLEQIIDLLFRVRSQVPDLELHIIGSIFEPARAYYERIVRKVAAHASWIFLHENCSRAELLQLISEQRYGIHGMEEEHFGIAVAELLRAGCIPFIPNSGGQVEIVGEEDALLYSSKEEAVLKILRVLNNPGLQLQLREQLRERKSLYTAEQFIRNMQDIVKEQCE